MNWRRFFRHLFATRRGLRAAFNNRVLGGIEQAVRASEASHRGEIRFVIEGSLHPAALWRGISATARAKRVFSELDVWDTEHNNGVLVYVLFADHAVEIVADRGFAGRVAADEWRSACRAMETQFAQGRYLEGSVAGIELIGRILARHYPAAGGGPNELADRPAVL
jgi:uncharacterized membrane protein